MPTNIHTYIHTYVYIHIYIHTRHLSGSGVQQVNSPLFPSSLPLFCLFPSFPSLTFLLLHTCDKPRRTVIFKDLPFPLISPLYLNFPCLLFFSSLLLFPLWFVGHSPLFFYIFLTTSFPLVCLAFIAYFVISPLSFSPLISPPLPTWARGLEWLREEGREGGESIFASFTIKRGSEGLDACCPYLSYPSPLTPHLLFSSPSLLLFFLFLPSLLLSSYSLYPLASLPLIFFYSCSCSAVLLCCPILSLSLFLSLSFSLSLSCTNKWQNKRKWLLYLYLTIVYI